MKNLKSLVSVASGSLIILALQLTLSLPVNISNLHADEQDITSVQEERAKLGRFLTYSPLLLNGGSQLTLISPNYWNSTVELLSNRLKVAHQELEDYFGNIPSFKTSIRLLDEDSFYQATGAPRWTNAMFYKGQILIPLPLNQEFDQEELYRSVKHEYTHAAIHSLSAGRCPGWIDEGLAQWAEGKSNPALKPALFRWVSTNSAVPLNLLQGGFTRLNNDMVPAAYAQSLFATNTIIDVYGFKALSRYFKLLRDDFKADDAFELAFGVSEQQFERILNQELNEWVSDYQRDNLNQS